MILYSTNVSLKFYIQQQYFNDTHYVWCSDNFDSKKLATYSTGYLVPASSNPADIYKELKQDVARQDRHSAKITAQKASFKALATRSHAAGIITQNDKDDIHYIVDQASFNDWRPLIYIIPKNIVQPRIQIVPIQQRASNGMEYIIEGLKSSEFHIIEP